MKYLTLLLILVTMALSCKKNQPIPFDDSFDCIPCASSYCVPVEQTDTNTIEVSLTEITGNLITNGDFASATGWTVGAQWAIASGQADFTSAGITPAANRTISRTIDSTITAGYYMVKIDIVTDVVSLITLEVKVGGTSITTVGTGSLEAQTYYLYKYITPSNNLIEIVAGSTAPNVSIDNVELYKMSSAQYTIQNCTTLEVFYTNDDNTDIVYYETDSWNNAEDVANAGLATITLDWTTIALADGCYCLCVKDAAIIGYEYIENGTFASSANWTITNTGAVGWVITGGQIVRNEAETGGEIDKFEQELIEPLDSTLCYNLTFDIISNGAWSFEIYYDTATLSNQGLSAPAGSGNASISISISSKAITDIRWQATGAFDSAIDNISLTADASCVLCETSNCISLREDWDAFCTERKMCNILVTGTNANKAFGFSAGYSFTGRIFGVIRNASYPDIDNTEYKDFTGLKSLQYNDNEKVQELQIAEIPKQAHDWIRLALRSQTLTLTIGAESKTFIKKPGDYAPFWRKTSPNAPVIVEIQEVQQVASNARNIS